MDFRGSALVGALVLAASASVVAIAVVTYYSNQPAPPPPATTHIKPTVSSGNQSALRALQERFVKAKLAHSQLQAELNSAQVHLSRRTRELARAEQRIAALQREIRNSSDLAAELLSATGTAGPDDSAPRPEPGTVAVAPAAGPAEPPDLNDRLQEREAQIAVTELEAERELAELAARHRAFRTAVRTGIARLGAGAVDGLSAMLESPNDDVRIWAAETLGSLGPAAVDAAGALGEAQRDNNPDVRAAARAALRQISE